MQPDDERLAGFGDEIEAARMEEIELMEWAAGRGPRPARGVPGHPAPGSAAGQAPPGPPLTAQELCALHRTAYPGTAWGRGEFRRREGGPWWALPLEALQRELLAVAAQAGLPGLELRSRLMRAAVDHLRVTTQVADAAWRLPSNLVPAQNGLLDVDTQTLRPYVGGDYVLNALPYCFEPEARAPAWEAFLRARVPEAAEFLQEFAGLALTPDMRHETALWLWGPPGSGKSTFLYGLMVLLGPRCGALGLAELLDGHFSPGLFSARTLLVCAEQNVDTVRDAARFNAFVSGEALTFRVKYRAPHLVAPTTKLAWAFTTLPRVLDADSALFRRVSLVPFPALDAAALDPGLKSRLVEEGPGLLNWALAGLQRLRARGKFAPPPCVLEAAEAFRLANDRASQFLVDCCVRDADGRMAGAALHKAYADWCRVEHLPAPANNQMASEWRRLGLTRKLSDGKVFWCGWRLKVR